MSSLLVVERMVIESLGNSKKAQKIKDLSEDTGLSEGLIRSIVFHLTNKGITIAQQGQVSLNWQRKDEWIPMIKNQEGIKTEIKELFSALVNHNFSEHQEEHKNERKIHLKKAWLSEYEHSLVQTKLRELDEFLDKISRQKKTNSKIKEQKVFIWGMSGYQTLVNELLHAV